MSAKPGSASADALVHYRIQDGGARDRLRSVYALALGLGMRESSGNTTEGRDITVKNPTPANAEAGLFQTSYDSIGVHPQLRALWKEYASGGPCRLETFREGVRDRQAPVIGSGEAARYQRFTKECPAFATEYVMIMLRYNRTHFGPINRQQAEFVPACERMLRRIEQASGC